MDSAQAIGWRWRCLDNDKPDPIGWNPAEKDLMRLAQDSSVAYGLSELLLVAFELALHRGKAVYFLVDISQLGVADTRRGTASDGLHLRA